MGDEFGLGTPGGAENACCCCLWLTSMAGIFGAITKVLEVDALRAGKFGLFGLNGLELGVGGSFGAASFGCENGGSKGVTFDVA